MGIHKLPPMPYAYDALEPYIDAKTMELHHTKHHQTYVTKLNEALDKYPELGEKSLEWLLGSLDQIPEDIRKAVQNHGGGHSNHSMFWKMMKPQGGGEPQGEISNVILKTFGDFKKFKEDFGKAATGVFGSGWAWFVYDEKKNFSIVTTANQDSPYMKGQLPLLGLDVWEHAYYLKYQNKRTDYIEAWWSVVNWEEVENNLKGVKG